MLVVMFDQSTTSSYLHTTSSWLCTTSLRPARISIRPVPDCVRPVYDQLVSPYDQFVSGRTEQPACVFSLCLTTSGWIKKVHGHATSSRSVDHMKLFDTWSRKYWTVHGWQIISPGVQPDVVRQRENTQTGRSRRLVEVVDWPKS